MKVNHHQIKNAVAHVSKLVEKDYPNKKHVLEMATFDSHYWIFTIDNLRFTWGTMDVFSDYRPPRHYVRLAEIDADESISLDTLFIETHGIGKVVDAAWGFMNHAEKISTAELMRIYPTKSYMRRYPSWRLGYSGLDNEHAEIEMYLHISNEGVIFDVELEYTKGEKARELAENFLKQSGEILNATKHYQYYESWETGIHTLLYKGFNEQTEPISLYLRVDAKNETIISHEIRILKSDGK